MTEEYAKNYRILGLPPDASWKQLRQAYKKLVNAWHPDRFQQNARKKKLAEEKTKEITQSYKELAEYYRKYGALPLTGKEEMSPASSERPSPSPAKRPHATDTSPETTSATPSQAAPKSRDFQKRAFHAVTAVVLLGFAYVIWQVAPHEQRGSPVSGAARNPAVDMARDEASMTTTEPEEAHFSVGSSLGEVYAIQGVPTRTEGDIWYYGTSKVYFSRGKVLRWDENIDNPLKTHALLETDDHSRLYFGLGSTREEVLAVQGAPNRDAGNVWEYGFSRVYFKNDRVTGWHEEPLMTLRVRR